MATFTPADYVILYNESSMDFPDVPTTGAWFVDITFSMLASRSDTDKVFGGFNTYGFWCNYTKSTNMINISYDATILASVPVQGIHHVKFGIDAQKNYFWQIDDLTGSGVAQNFPASNATFHLNSRNGIYGDGRLCVYSLKLGTDEQNAQIWEPAIIVNDSTTYYGVHNVVTGAWVGHSGHYIYNTHITQYVGTQSAIDAWMTNARVLRTTNTDGINFNYPIALPVKSSVKKDWFWSIINVRDQYIGLYPIENTLTTRINYNERDGASQDIAIEILKIGEHYAVRLVVRYRAYYSSDTTRYYIQYLLIDTGDIIVCPDSIPSSYFTGNFSVVNGSTISYTKPTSMPWAMTILYDPDISKPQFTLVYEAKEYGVSNPINPINLNDYSRLRNVRWSFVLNNYWHEYTYKLMGYLIESEGNVYTVEDGELQPIPDGAINWETFQQYALDAPPDGSLLLDLVDPKVYYWDKWGEAQDLPDLKATLHAYNQNRIIVSTPMDISMATGVSFCAVQYANAPKIALKFDDGNWEMYSGSAWVEAGDGEGMSPQVMLGISSADWTTKFANKSLLTFRVVFDTIDDKISLIRFKFST